MNREALNRWIEEKITASGLSLRELGRRSGIDQSGISKVLNGQRDGGLEFYVKIAQVFNAVPEMLQVAGIVGDETGADLSLLELFRIIRRLSPEQQREVETFVDYLLSKPGKATDDKTSPAAGNG